MLDRKRFMVGKYLLRYTVFVDGKRGGAPASMPTESVPAEEQFRTTSVMIRARSLTE